GRAEAAQAAAARAGRRDTGQPTMTACIAVHNGAAYLSRKLDSLWAQAYPGLDALVFCDGSTDGGAEIVRDHAARGQPVRLLRSEVRRGKPHALNRMQEEATGEVLVLTDARQPLAAGAVRALAAELSDPRVGCVSGQLLLDGVAAHGAGAAAYWRYEAWIR